MRYLKQHIINDLEKKMVFLAGPRQVGKTTLVRDILKSKGQNQGLYLNYDFDEDRESILKKRWLPENKLLVFDEFHKYPKWKNWIKGLYDIKKDIHQFLLTGSARMDIYKRGGDSLLGRYHYWRLHPFTLNELPSGFSADLRKNPQMLLDRLLKFGGFPEPFIDADEREARRWRQERIRKIIRDDVRDLESVKNIGQLEILVELLRSRVGGMISNANLATDLGISPHTVKEWIAVLEKMYLLFTVPPYTTKLAKTLSKPNKIYFYDNGDVLGDEGAIFENCVATHLLKYLNFREDYEGRKCELKYIRDKQKREVDFALLVDNQLEEIIEVKWRDDKISSSLEYYANHLKPKKVIQIVSSLSRPYENNGIYVMDLFSYLKKNSILQS